MDALPSDSVQPEPESPTPALYEPDLSACVQFLRFWHEVTAVPHVTLTAIVPDGPTSTSTFPAPDFPEVEFWIGKKQQAGCNVYWQCNETPARCTKKPSKDLMIAVLCRHADIDPLDAEFSYADERERLKNLADLLAQENTMPPTAIIDSGSGIQLLWATERETCSTESITRIEAENRHISEVLSGDHSQNIDRLLRLPGTVNFPNAKKQRLGRPISFARLLHANPTLYSADEAARIPTTLSGLLRNSQLVRLPTPELHSSEPEDSATHENRGRDRSRVAFRIAAELHRDGGVFEDLRPALLADRATAEWLAEKGEKHEGRELKRVWEHARPRPEKNNLPVILIAAGQSHSMATHAEQVLMDASLPIYQRGSQLVRPIQNLVPAARGQFIISAGLTEVRAPYLLDVLSQSANWKRWDERTSKWVKTDPSDKAITVLMHRVGKWNFHPIAGVITSPTLRPDGTVLLESGYDPVTRLYHVKDPALDLSSLPDNPTKADAEAAAELLTSLLVGFPLVAAVDWAVALSGMITVVARGAISVAPLHLMRATTAGTGKSFLVDVIATIATGRVCPVASASVDAHETEKRLNGLLLAGYPIVSIDNINGILGGDLLCQAVERPLVRVRRLGTSDITELESRTTLFATGNAIRVEGDMTRRAILADLDAQTERPELREFSFNPVTTVLEDRGRYVAACLTIVRAYAHAGFPDLLPPLGSYEDWSRWVRSALVWLGSADPAQTMEKLREDDPVLEALRFVLSAWYREIGTRDVTLREVVDHALGTPQASYDSNFETLGEALLRIAEEFDGINVRRLAKWLPTQAGRIVSCETAHGDINLKFARSANGHGGLARWRVAYAE